MGKGIGSCNITPSLEGLEMERNHVGNQSITSSWWSSNRNSKHWGWASLIGSTLCVVTYQCQGRNTVLTPHGKDRKKLGISQQTLCPIFISISCFIICVFFPIINHKYNSFQWAQGMLLLIIKPEHGLENPPNLQLVSKVRMIWELLPSNCKGPDSHTLLTVNEPEVHPSSALGWLYHP